MNVAHILAQSAYQPGDPPPEGYLAWHEWATAQHKAGLRQVPCGACSKWRYPQELSDRKPTFEARDRTGRIHRIVSYICLACERTLPWPWPTGKGIR